MRLKDCIGCEWLYTKTLSDTTEYLCTYSKFHQTGMKYGKNVHIERIKHCKKRNPTKNDNNNPK